MQRSQMIIRNFHTSSKLLYLKFKNLKNKKYSSQQWLLRQMKDPYVEKAKRENYRCRSAFKLLEVQEKYSILKPGMIVVDCGASPGSWTQVAVNYTNAHGRNLDEDLGTVIAIDRNPIHDITGATIVNNLDFTTDLAQSRLKSILDDKFADVVLSDMAPNATGIKAMDHDNIIALVYSALKFALEISSYDACFLAKIWDGSKANNLLRDVERFYKQVKWVRPDSTRSDSAEQFILARGFKGLRTQPRSSWD